MVLGLARGGVPVGSEVAATVGAPLDVFVVRKLGVPQWPELAMGAIASGGAVILNDHVVAGLQISDAQLRAAIDAETAELDRRESAYRGTGARLDLRSKTVIIADDGIATGATMLVAVKAVRTAEPQRVIVTAPVGSPAAHQRLRGVADDIVVATMPSRFDAVGQVFADFHQVTDDEVRELLS